jgi:hypothetical protein
VPLWLGVRALPAHSGWLNRVGAENRRWRENSSPFRSVAARRIAASSIDRPIDSIDVETRVLDRCAEVSLGEKREMLLRLQVVAVEAELAVA